MRLQKRFQYTASHKNLLALETAYNKLQNKKLINLAELKPKNVLDLGSRKSSFAQELRKYDINAYSVDMFDGKPANIGSHVRAFAEELPFKLKRVYF